MVPLTCSSLISPIGESVSRSLMYSDFLRDLIVWPPFSICVIPELLSDSNLVGIFPNKVCIMIRVSSISSNVCSIAFTSAAVLLACFYLSDADFQCNRLAFSVSGQVESASCTMKPLLPQ